MKHTTKHLLSTIFLVCFAAVVSAATVSYTADDATRFSNPERGFITMLEGHLTKSKPFAVKGQESVLDNYISTEKMSIILVHYYLENYRTTATLPEEILNGFDTDMQVLRNKGMKAILRFSYTNATYKNHGEVSAADASLDIVKSHIEQYRSHWQANADVIFVFQAGFVGAWGEWYYTDNFGNQGSTMNSKRRELLDSLLSAVPSDRCIQLRTPLFKTGYTGTTTALTASEAYQNTPKARLAHHNDAFLTDETDMGTYSNPSTQKPFISQETLYVPLGGESCITEDAVAETNATYEKTTAEMRNLHWTFIQSGYSTVVTNRWRNDGTFAELNKRMGYRLQLVSGSFSDEVGQGSKMAVYMEIKNTGYAPLYNARTAYIVLKDKNNSSSFFSIPLEADPRSWLPNGSISTVSEQLTVPSSVPAGDYQLYLYMPDAYSSLASDARYAVRFANDNVWEAASGMNKLNAVVTVKNGSTPPPPEPPITDAIALPATLNKANVKTYSEDMTWFNTDYFDFGPTDAPNLDRWAEWKVELKYPGKYELTEEYYCENGHGWQFQLLDGGSAVATYETGSLEGNISPNVFANKWDLSSVSPKVYTLRVKNVRDWSQPKLRSLKFEYDGTIPTEVEIVESPKSKVESSQKILRDGQILIIREGKMYNIYGAEVR